MKSHTARNVLLLLLGLLGAGAMLGGGVLMISPSGKTFGMPLSMLEHSPFHDFLLPGIVLFIIPGAIPVMLVFALTKKPASKFAEMFNCYEDMHWAWPYCIYVAFALLIWLQTEMTILHAVHWSHSLYMAIAITILFVALLPGVRALYNAQDSAVTKDKNQ